jgi:hypothetical protein
VLLRPTAERVAARERTFRPAPTSPAPPGRPRFPRPERGQSSPYRETERLARRIGRGSDPTQGAQAGRRWRHKPRPAQFDPCGERARSVALAHEGARRSSRAFRREARRSQSSDEARELLRPSREWRECAVAAARALPPSELRAPAPRARLRVWRACRGRTRLSTIHRFRPRWEAMT